MNYIMDSSALIAYLWKESGYTFVKSIITDSNNRCFIHVINFCEVYYDLIRRVGVIKAKQITEKVSNLITVRYDMDEDFWQQAGKYKADIRRVSLADCFCITLTQRMLANVLTADHHEFDKLVDKGIINIKFIR